MSVEAFEENMYENVTSCLASSIISQHKQAEREWSNSFQRPLPPVSRSRTDLDIEIPSHYDVPRRLIQHRSRSLTALNTLTTHHQIHVGSSSRAESSSPLSDKSVELISSDVVSGRIGRIGSPPVLMPSDSTRHTAAALEMMSTRDKSVYNSLGNSSSKEGKPSYALLGLTKNVIKTGIMSKTGPTPSWCAKWNRRVFVLKGNFLFYFDPVDKPIQSAPVLGGVYIKNAMIERISLAFTKRILRITPQVARRSGWDKHNHSEAFYIKFRSEEGRDEWYDVLTRVSTSKLDSL